MRLEIQMSLTYRPATQQDIPAVFAVLRDALADLERRAGTPEAENVWTDPVFVGAYWSRRRALYEHLGRTAEHCWVAEEAGVIVGYARATWNDGVRELTECFVRPGHQAAGVGRELLARAFPPDGAQRLVIIASTDLPALALYLRSGATPRFPIYPLVGRPRTVNLPTDLGIDPIPPGTEALAAMGAVDRAVLGFRRDADHAFLLTDRQAYLYRRGGHVVGYGYVGDSVGPIALLEPTDFPSVLAHAESAAAASGTTSLRLIVPLVNRAAVDHLLRRGFRLDPFPMYLMSNEPFGSFERYVGTSPPLFL